MTSGLLCIGDNVVDLYLDKGVFFPGGNALNVAVLARRFGLADVAYMGIVGNDREGDHVRACMLAESLSIAPSVRGICWLTSAMIIAAVSTAARAASTDVPREH